MICYDTVFRRPVCLLLTCVVVVGVDLVVAVFLFVILDSIELALQFVLRCKDDLFSF